LAAARFEIRRKRNGQFHFVLISGNGQIVATSETYTTKARAKAGIASVQKIAAGAGIVDLAEDGRKAPTTKQTTAKPSKGKAAVKPTAARTSQTKVTAVRSTTKAAAGRRSRTPAK
jgi:uncharacterized protein